MYAILKSENLQPPMGVENQNQRFESSAPGVPCAKWSTYWGCRLKQNRCPA